MSFNPGSALTPSHDDPLEDSVLIRLTETASARVGCVAPLEALAVVLGVICGYIRKRSVAHDGEAPITRECLAAHALFYGFQRQLSTMSEAPFDHPRPSRPRNNSAHTSSQSATAPALMPNTTTGL